MRNMSTDGRDGFVRATQEPQARTRAFARVLGPWLLIVPSIIALRAPEMGAIHIRILRKPAVRVIRGRSPAVRPTTDHRISAVLVERGGGDHRAVRLDAGSPRPGPHGRSQTLRTRRWVYGHDTSWAARVRCPRSDRAYLTYVGRAARLASAAAKDTP